MPRWRDHIPNGAWPKRLPGTMAAAYTGRCYASFKRKVDAGEYPLPIEDNPQRWDLDQLRDALDNPDRNTAPSPAQSLEDFRARRRAARS